MTGFSVRNCPICKDAEVEILHRQKFALPEGHPLADGYDVVCCVRCGFVYADTTATQEDYERFYAEFSKYEDKQFTTGTGETPWDAKRLQDTARQIAVLVANKKARILDMGCANGGLLKSLSQLGFQNLYGIDPSPVCVENVKRLGLEARVGSLFNLPAEIGQFDCVILSHILEHVQDLKSATQSISRLTKSEGGGIYVEVPNAARYTDYTFAPFQDFNTEHINHFSIATLSNLLGPVGYSLREQGMKLIESSPNMPYPALYSVWDKTEQASSNFRPVKDDKLVGSIQAYIAKSQAIMDGIDTRLRQALAQLTKVIIWGTGQLAMKLLVETCLANATIAAFVDSNPINQGKKLLGVPILSPERLSTFPYPIIVTTILHQEDVVQQIYSMRLSNDVVLLNDQEPQIGE